MITTANLVNIHHHTYNNDFLFLVMRNFKIYSLCCCSVAQSCLTLFNPMDWGMLGFPVLHHLPELAQTHVHWVSDAIQPSHPLSSLSPPALNISQHQGLFQWVGSSHQVAALASVYSLSNFQICNAVLLTVVTILYITSISFLFQFLDSTKKWNQMVFVIFVSLILLPIMPSRSIYVVANGMISFQTFPIIFGIK